MNIPSIFRFFGENVREFCDLGVKFIVFRTDVHEQMSGSHENFYNQWRKRIKISVSDTFSEFDTLQILSTFWSVLS